MLVQVDWYKTTGKWSHGDRIELTLKPGEKNLLEEVIIKQKSIITNWWKSQNYYVVLSDITESENDPNYRITYSRLYTPEDCLKAGQNHIIKEENNARDNFLQAYILAQRLVNNTLPSSCSFTEQVKKGIKWT